MSQGFQKFLYQSAFCKFFGFGQIRIITRRRQLLCLGIRVCSILNVHFYSNSEIDSVVFFTFFRLCVCFVFQFVPTDTMATVVHCVVDAVKITSLVIRLDTVL